jgi:hypothetical protein
VWWPLGFRLDAILIAAGCRHGKVMMGFQTDRDDDMLKSTESVAHAQVVTMVVNSQVNG